MIPRHSLRLEREVYHYLYHHHYRCHPCLAGPSAPSRGQTLHSDTVCLKWNKSDADQELHTVTWLRLSLRIILAVPRQRLFLKLRLEDWKLRVPVGYYLSAGNR
ncbi:hypothetical protein E2C01_007446 [Portunus trituberculatus]|uniref:Uncharacterized protein n=1 Tax=Portunus trituberculatus TaxID=210409 RepID=A0A5B7D066_PORTR|nr:hypothetical protein [Portunus trituberculatus]